MNHWLFSGTLNRRLQILGLIAGFCLAPAWVCRAQAQEEAEPPLERHVATNRSETKPSRTSSRARSHRTSKGDRIVIGNDLVLKEGETAQQVVVIGGSAVIDGKVNEDVVVVLGKARIGPRAEIRHELVIVGGALEADPAAKIGESTVLLGGLGGNFNNATWLLWPSQWLSSGLLYGRPLPHQHWWSWALVGVCLLLYLILAVLFPRQIQSAVTALEERPGNAWLTGVLAFMLFGPALLLLIVTVVGTVVVPFALAAFLAAFVFGKVAVYRYAGQQLGSQMGLKLLQQPAFALISGLLLFCLLYTIPVLGFVVWAAVAPLGLGAVLLAGLKRSQTVGSPGAESVGLSPSGAGTSGTLATAEGTDVEARAGFWLRLLANLLDLMLVGMIAVALLHKPRWFLLLWVIYHLIFWTWRATTVGGLVLGLQIVRLDNKPMNFGVAAVRLLGSFFSIAALGLGFFWGGLSRTKQSWHDLMAGTVIVKLSRNRSLI